MNEKGSLRSNPDFQQNIGVPKRIPSPESYEDYDDD